MFALFITESCKLFGTCMISKEEGLLPWDPALSLPSLRTQPQGKGGAAGKYKIRGCAELPYAKSL